MGNANVFRQLKERYDRANMLPAAAASSSSAAIWSPTSTSPQSTIVISPFVPDSPRTPSSVSSLGEHHRSASCNDIASMDTSSLSVEGSPVTSPSSSPRPSISVTPTPSPPATPSSSSSVKLPSFLSPSSSSSSPSSAASTPTSVVTPVKRSKFSRASLTAAIKQKISRPKKDPLPPWIPTTPELILDEKGLHEVFDRFDADRNGALCMKEMKTLLLQLLEYCIAVEKALLKQATANGDSISMELAQHSLIRLQLTQATPRLFNDWCRDLHTALDTNKDGRLDRNDFVSSFNRHLQLY